MGWETYHVTSPKHGFETGQEEVVDGLHFFRTPRRQMATPGLREIELMWHLRKRIEQVVNKVKPELIHAHSPALNALPAISIGGKYGLPVVYEVRAFWEDAAVDHGTSREWGLRYRMTRHFETYVMQKANQVTTICEGLRKDIVARGIQASRVTVVPNAVDCSIFKQGRVLDEGLKRSLGLEGSRVIGYVGSFYAYEGLDLLLKAYPKILEYAPDVRILLVGGGAQEPVLKSMACDLGVEDKVVFVGRIPHEKVQDYYGVLDLMIYPRKSMRLTDLVTPLKPLEAMAQGRLLVASDVGGHKELIRDGETGWLFVAGDPDSLTETVLRALSARDDWDRVSMDGRRFVESERNWSTCVERYNHVYMQALTVS